MVDQAFCDVDAEIDTLLVAGGESGDQRATIQLCWPG
jgi:hypothetical protein